MKKMFLVALILMATTGKADQSLHGSRASFLFQDRGLMTLGYLNESEGGMAATEALMAQNGDTHVYLYTRNDDERTFGISHIRPAADWEARIDRLNSKGFKPILWLTPDDSPSIQRAPLEEHKRHYAEMVRRFDGKVAGYVTALEVDETWSAAQAQEMTAYLKSLTKKPVGVHMTDGVGGLRGDVSYYAGADYIYLQTGFDKSPEVVAAMVAQANALGIPVILSEYHLDSDSPEAMALGAAGCGAGAVGTGNGAPIGLYCGTPVFAEEKKQEWYEKYGEEIGAGVVAIAAGYIIYRLITQDDDVEFASRLNFGLDGLDNYMEGSLSYQATESIDVGVRVDNAGRKMGFFNIRF